MLVLLLGSAATLAAIHIVTIPVVVIHTSSATVTRLMIVPALVVVISFVVVEAPAVATAVEAPMPTIGLVVVSAVSLLVVLGELDLDRVVFVERRSAVHLCDSCLGVLTLRKFQVSKAATVPSLVILDHVN